MPLSFFLKGFTMTDRVYYLQALQVDGNWYVISSHATFEAAEDEMWSRAGWRYGRVRYCIHVSGGK